jgi:exonuclease SbcC
VQAVEVAREAEAYRCLVAAFGRQGIPARVIAAAIPEIQAEANAVLERLSDGDLAVSLETERASQKGTVSETVDLTVWAGGTSRDLALLSGGEAFRVGFALRVALSRLLTRRAGIRLEMLVIDEGFGSQDMEGRGRMIDALQRVADEFALVLVVTHVEDLKDAFSDRIEVSKHTSTGSLAMRMSA